MGPSRRNPKTEETPEILAKTGWRKSLDRLWPFSDLSSPRSAFMPNGASKSSLNLSDRRSNSPTLLNKNLQLAASASGIRSSSFQLYTLESPPAQSSVPSNFG